MSIFSRIFGRVKPPARETSRAEIIGGGNAFSAWSGNAYSNDIFRSAVDAIARNAAKLKGSHIIKYRDHEQVTGDCKLNRMLQVEPNPYMSAFDMLYKLFTHYFLYNNAFAYIQKDERGQCVAVFPLNPVHAEFLSDTGGALYVRFIFSGGREVILPYADIVHLRRNFNGNDILGDPNDALSPALQLAHTQNEGIVSAIKTGASIRGILKRTQLANADILKEMRENFIQDYLNINNNGGIAVLDSAAEYIPIDNKPYAIDEKQMQAVKQYSAAIFPECPSPSKCRRAATATTRRQIHARSQRLKKCMKSASFRSLLIRRPALKRDPLLTHGLLRRRRGRKPLSRQIQFC